MPSWRECGAALTERGEWENTVIVVTSDHGEQLGDQGLVQKAGFYEASYAVVGIVRDPRYDTVGVVDEFTENVDIMPTLCEAMGIDVPAQCDGLPAHPVPARRAAQHVARCGVLRVGLARRVHSARRTPVAVGPPARTTEPGGAPQP